MSNVALFVNKLRNKTCFPCLQPGENRGERLGEFESRSVSPGREFSQTLPRFSTSYGGTDKTCFISFINFLFSLLTKRKTIYKARTVNSLNSETVNHIAHVIFVLHSAMKTHLQTNQNACTIQIIL